MKMQDLGIPIVTFAIGITAGLATRPYPQDPGDSLPLANTPAETNSRPGGAGEAPGSPPATRQRLGSFRAPEVPRIAIPVQAVSGFLKSNGQFRDVGFDRLGQQMTDPMSMLGVPAADQENVLAMLAAAADEVLAEEKARFRIAKAEPSSITVDLSGMEEPVARIASQTKQRLTDLLPPEAAEILSGAVDWDRYYFGYEGRQTEFSITREANGSLLTIHKTAHVTFTGRPDPSVFPDDGAPIPAEKLLSDPRWKTIFAGQTLLPPPR